MTVVGVCAVWPGVALGHGGSSGGDFRSEVTSIEPASLPLEVEMKGGDDQLRIENVGDRELVVFGYNQVGADNPDGWEDPYLRIGPDGVFVNTNSTAYYQNQGRYGAEVPEGKGERDALPKWKLVREAPPSYSFHDHRMHWMARSVPPNVDADSPREQKVTDWEVPFRYGGELGVARGTLTYVGGKEQASSTIEFVLLAAAVGAMLVVFAVDWRRRRRVAAAHLNAAAHSDAASDPASPGSNARGDG